MTSPRMLLRRLRALFQRGKLDAEMSAEMRAHLEMQTQQNIARGMSPDEARYAARRAFGGEEQIKERARDGRGLQWLEHAGRDLKFACRRLAQAPGYTLVAVVTLALGIGLNTGMFSLINSVLLRPLPFPDSGQLVRLHRVTPKNPHGGFSPADFLDLERNAGEFGLFAAYDNSSVSVSDPGQPAAIQNTMRVSADYFKVLQVVPQLGRFFRPVEETRGNHRVVVISDALWQDRFARAPDVLGRMLRIDGEPHEIVGVLPAAANDGRVIREVRLFLPLSFTDSERANRGNAALNLIGRRHAALTETQGNAWVAAFGARLATDFPQENAGSGWRSESLHRATGNSSGRAIMAMLLGLAGFVLLIACANLANLLLTRTIARAHELAVRAALGASRLRLIRPLVFESLLLALLGGAGAVVVAIWAGDWLSAQSTANDGSPMSFPLDWRVLGFALLASLGTALFFGVVPALFTLRVNVNDSLKNGARGSTAGRAHRRWRQLLVIGQFASALTLLAGAGFFVRGANNLAHQLYGWDPAYAVLGGVQLPKAIYPGAPEIIAFHRQALERLGQLPGAKAASVSYALPVNGLPGPRPYRIEGRASSAPGQEIAASYNGVTAGYFDVAGTRLVSGRVFNATDTATSPKTAIINEAMARALFPGENPIGRRLARANAEPPAWAEIVGVVADISSIGVYRSPVPFQVYQPFEQEPRSFATLAVRTAGVAPSAMIAPIRAVVAGLDPDLPVQGLMSIETQLERAAFDLHMLEKMLGAFAVLGLALASLGIYGVIARTVAQRRGEIGIRMALGAQARDITGMILGSGVRLAITGAGLGLLGALGLSRLIAGIMPAMQTNGGLVLAVATGLLLLIALLACWLPARRAAKVDPMVALRAE